MLFLFSLNIMCMFLGVLMMVNAVQEGNTIALCLGVGIGAINLFAALNGLSYLV